MNEQPPTGFWERTFRLSQRGSNVPTEVRGGVATFLTMAYILFVNPQILAAAGVPVTGAMVGTAIVSGVASILMGLIGNFPLALAPGMGLNAMVAFTIAKQAGSWQAAMGLVFLDGLVVLILVLAGLRQAVLRAIPMDLKHAIGVGLGFFLAFIGLVNCRLVTVSPGVVAQPGAALPPVTFGDVTTAGAIVAIAGTLLIALLLVLRVKGAILIGILAGTILGLILGVARLPEQWAAPEFSTLGRLDLAGALRLQLVPLLLALVVVDFFDTLGTVTAIGGQSGLMDAEGRIEKIERILGVDAVAAMIGGFCGASSATSYVESAAGVGEGARTGLSSVVVGILFLIAVVAAPLAAIIPPEATAPALIIVGFLMMASVREIDFSRLDTALPAFVTFITMPLTYSISHGIGYGFIAYTVLKILTGRWREVHPLMYGASLVFAVTFAVLPAG